MDAELTGPGHDSVLPEPWAPAFDGSVGVLDARMIDVLDQLFDAAYVVDRRRRILFWNRAAEALTGFSRDEVVGSHCWNRILNHVDVAGRSLCAGHCPLAHAMEIGRPHEGRVFLHHREGHRLPVSVRVVPLRDRDGRVLGAVEVFRADVAEAPDDARLAELRRQALIDTLTGLPNRRMVEMTLRARFDEMERYGWSFGVLFADIDRFKAINDTYGHHVGDKVLRMVGRTLAAITRPFDVTGRWGGEEFLTVTAHVSRAELKTIARRFRVLVERSSLDVPGGALSVTVSIGVASVRPGDTVDSLVERADRLMYRSKALGRNRVTIERAPARPSRTVPRTASTRRGTGGRTGTPGTPAASS